MTAVNSQEYRELNDEQSENRDIIPTGLKIEENLGNDIDNGTIIMDVDCSYLYQEPGKMGKSLQELSIISVKEVDVPISTSKRKNYAQSSLVSYKKSKVVQSTNSNVNLNKIDPKSADETINSNIGNQEEIYEFNENEKDPGDPENAGDPDYKCKGIIKNDKKSTTNELLFKCMLCSYQVGKKFLLSRHLKTHSDERPHKCCLCDKGFKTTSALSNHRNIHLGHKPHQCSSCEMAFTTSGELMRHVRYRHTHIKPHKCTECDYSSVEMSKLRRHMRCHTGERPYQCPHCTYASPDTFKLKRHMRIHTGEKPYECDICHSRFTQSNSLKLHRLIHSVNEKPVFQCHLCPTTCGRKTDLRLHIKKLHSSDHPMPCKRCGKELPDRYSYKMHIKTHEGEKCYRCKYCPYASVSQRHLESHVYIHLNAKPFVCSICQSRFRQKPLLTRHMKIYHSDIYVAPEPRKKDHKCPHCNKMFAFNGNLIRHMEIHDPTSRLFEEKERLRMGRMTRVLSDGTVVESTSNNLLVLNKGNEETFYKDTEEQNSADDPEIQEEYEEIEVYNEDNIQYVYDNYEVDEYKEDYEKEQGEEIINVRHEEMKSMDIAETTVKTSIIIKNEEHDNSEIIYSEVQDEQGFTVIEVLPDDDDDVDEYNQVQEKEELAQKLGLQAAPTNNKKEDKPIKTESSQSKTLILDYFGFEVNEEDDEETKGAIKLLEMIEEV